jgi:hypothetical protein
MPKFERILNLFPGFYATSEGAKLLHEIVRLLGRPLEEADTQLFRIQRAHRLKVAEHANDILLLAGALNLNRFHFEDILVDSSLFGVGLELRSDLDASLVSTALQEDFENHGILLSGTSTITVRRESCGWSIDDPVNRRSYILRKEKKFLHSIRSEYSEELDEGIISQGLQQEFAQSRIELPQDALVSIEEMNQKWQIGRGNHAFIICKENDVLNVYRQEKLNVYEPYEQKLRVMRERIQRIARLHLKGLGTLWTVMDSAAIFLNATIVPEITGDPLIKHFDESLLSHKSVVEFTHIPGKPRERIYLYENPLRRIKVEPAEKWPLNSWTVENRDAESSPAKFLIRGVKDRTVLPGIFCPESQEGIVFNGIVPNGKTLVIDEDNGAVLDNRPVDEWLVYFKGGIFDFSRFGADTVAGEHVGSAEPFDGDIEGITSRPFQKKRPVPKVSVGRSKWHFKVAEGVFDGNDFDYSVYATNHQPIGLFDEGYDFDECVFDVSASGVVGMVWDERIPCCFKLLLPHHIPQSWKPKSESTSGPTDEHEDAQQPMNVLSRIGNILPRFKAAGIQAFVDTAKDAWILGDSVIRSRDVSEGEGAGYHATRLQSQNVNLFLPLDPML